MRYGHEVNMLKEDRKVLMFSWNGLCSCDYKS